VPTGLAAVHGRPPWASSWQHFGFKGLDNSDGNFVADFGLAGHRFFLCDA
jgi:hypothetical protein